MKLPGLGPTHWPTSNPTLAKVAGAQTQTDQRMTESPDSCESNMLSEKEFPETWHTSKEVKRSGVDTFLYSSYKNILPLTDLGQSFVPKSRIKKSMRLLCSIGFMSSKADSAINTTSVVWCSNQWATSMSASCKNRTDQRVRCKAPGGYAMSGKLFCSAYTWTEKSINVLIKHVIIWHDII